ncbi:MAG: branched-chain amino acid ABC transporter permease [Candidatus Bathyarchaeia archaeon]
MKPAIKVRKVKIHRLILAVTPIIILALIPLFLTDPYIIHVLTIACIYAILSASWDMLSGYTGQISLGHAVFFGGGAYVAAFLTMSYNFPPPLCIPIAGVVVTLFSIIIGVPSLRVTGPYLTITTLAFAETVKAIVIAFPGITRGEEGFPVRTMVHGTIPNFYVSLVLMTFSVTIMHFIANRRLRIPLTAIRENEVTAQASGLNVTKYKVLSFAISAFFAGVAGSFYCYYTMMVSPALLSIDTSFMAFAMGVVGGMGTIIGPVIGAYMITILSELLRSMIARAHLLIYGIIFIAFIMLMPEGIIKLLSKIVKKRA